MKQGRRQVVSGGNDIAVPEMFKMRHEGIKEAHHEKNTEREQPD